MACELLSHVVTKKLLSSYRGQCLVLWPRVKPGPLQWAHGFLATEPLGKSHHAVLYTSESIHLILGILCIDHLHWFFPPPPYPQPLVATSLFSVSMNLDHRKYEQDHIVFVFLCVVSLNIMVSSSLHVVANGRISLFLWLNNILLYIYHIFFSHLSVSECLCCFHV